MTTGKLPNSTQRTPETLQSRWHNRRSAFLNDVSRRSLRFTIWTAEEQVVTGSLSFAPMPSRSRITAGAGRWNHPWRAEYATGNVEFLEDKAIALTGTPRETTPGYGNAPNHKEIRPYPDVLFHGGILEIGIIDLPTISIKTTHTVGNIAAMTLIAGGGELLVWGIDDPMPSIETTHVS